MTNILCALSYVQVFYTFFIVLFQPLNFWQTFDFVCCVWEGGVDVFGTLLESKFTRISYSTSWFDPSNPSVLPTHVLAYDQC